MLVPTFILLLIAGFAAADSNSRAQSDDSDLVERAEVPHCVLMPNAPNCEKRLVNFNPNCVNNYFDPECMIIFKRDPAIAKRVSDYCKLHACITQKKRGSVNKRFMNTWEQCMFNPSLPQCYIIKKRLMSPVRSQVWPRLCLNLPDDPICHLWKKRDTREIMSSLCQAVPDDPACKNWRKRDTREIMASLCQAFPDDPACKNWRKRDTREIMASLCQAFPDDPACKNWRKRDTREIMASLCQAFPDDPACKNWRKRDTREIMASLCQAFPDDPACKNWRKRDTREIMASLCQAFPDDPACKNWRKRDDSWMYWEMVCEEKPFLPECVNKWW